MATAALGRPPASAEDTGTPRLFTPGRIGGVEIRNRVIMPAMTTRAADADGFVTEQTIAYFAARAAGGVGLVTVEMASPEKVGKHRHHELGLHDECYLPGLTRLVAAIHAEGAKAAIQLGHAGGHTRIDVSGEPPIAPSAIPHVVQEGTTETIVPLEMSPARIEESILAYATSAERAARAGFDVVEVHAAHGYLISQFLCPAENLRTDAYGGSVENRARFGCRVIAAIKRLRPGLAVVFRFNGDDYFPGGLTRADAIAVARLAEAAGADAIHVSAGHYRSLPSAAVMIPPMVYEEGVFLPFAAAVKAVVRVPIVTVGRLGRPELAVAAVESGQADFVALGRPLLADPDWVAKARAGRAMRTCLSCNTCVDTMRSGSRTHCLVNPVTGRELAFGDQATRAARLPRGKRIAVIGAGPAGLSYAALVGPGNDVTVFERDTVPGGSFRLAGLAPTFQGVEAVPESFARYVEMLERECREAGIAFVYGEDVTAKPSRLRAFDHVVVAAGARYRWGLGPLIRGFLRSGLAQAKPFRAVAASERVRHWLYHVARTPAGPAIALRIGHRSVELIGDARAAGKSDAAIRSAYEAAYGTAA